MNTTDLSLIRITSLVAAFFSLTAPVHSFAQIDRGPPRAAFVSGGAARSVPVQVFQPAGPVRILNKKSSDTAPTSSKLQNAIDELSRLDTTLSLLIIEGDSIIHESYRQPAGPSEPITGFSISKSVVAYTLAFPFCEGKISSVADRADTYAEALKGTLYGESSIENILTMRSGAPRSAAYGLSRASEPNEIWTGKSTLVQLLKEQSANPTKVGVDFNYHNNNAQALVEIMNSIGGFEKIFREKIWENIGAEYKSYWMRDKDNNLYGGSGLMMTTRDWGRLALYFSDMYTGAINACISEYMKKSSSRMTDTGEMVKNTGFKSYGYQTWMHPIFGSNKGFWLVGAGGQHIAIEPISKKILVLHSHGSLHGRVDYVIKAFTALLEK